jgi:glutaredoxin
MKGRLLSGPRRIVGAALLMIACLAPMVVAGNVHGARDAGKGKPVWIVLFAAQDCPRCEAVKELLSVMRERYPLRVRSFDVGKDADYRLFRCLEKIHSEESFAVPLIMVNETILMGERAIAENLEKIVARLTRAGGSPLPYLGPPDTESPAVRRNLPRDCNCDEGSRPPTLGEELRRIRGLLDGLR